MAVALGALYCTLISHYEWFESVVRRNAPTGRDWGLSGTALLEVSGLNERSQDRVSRHWSGDPKSFMTDVY